MSATIVVFESNAPTFYFPQTFMSKRLLNNSMVLHIPKEKMNNKSQTDIGDDFA